MSQSRYKEREAKRKYSHEIASKQQAISHFKDEVSTMMLAIEAVRLEQSQANTPAKPRHERVQD